MKLEFTEIQKMLQTAARQFLEAECTKPVVRQIRQTEAGYSPELWRKMAKLGWTGMPFPEAQGGAGLGLLDMVVLYGEMGRALLPSPHLSSVMLSGLTLLDAGNQVQIDEFIPGIAAGEICFTLAVTEPDYGWEPGFISTAATADGEDFLIRGTKLFVPYAGAADYILTAVRTGDTASEASISLLMVPADAPGLTVTPLHGSIGEPLAEITYDGVRVPASSLVGALNGGWDLLQATIRRGSVLQCAEMTGGIEYILELATAYGNDRIQFGQYVGSFQRIQDRVINILNGLDKARWTTYEAAWRLDQGLDATVEVAVARMLSNRAYSTASDEAAHIFAGAGFMRDFDLWLYHQKSWTVEHYLGGLDLQRRTIAAAVLDS